MLIRREIHVIYKRLLPLLTVCALITGNVLASENTQSIVLDTHDITLSGLSSGGYMATQFHFSHPELVSGVGIVAAGPYGCAQNAIMTALGNCVDKAPDTYADEIVNITKTLSASSLRALQNDKAWLFHGTLDTRIAPEVAQALQAQYTQILAPNNVAFINDKPVAHLFPTLENGVSCDESISPFIGNCGFDAAGHLLTFLLGELQEPLANATQTSIGELMTVEQHTLAKVDKSGLHQSGFVYLPAACRNGEPCKVHISFHGCNQSIDNVGDQYASNTGLNEWAASNRIVVLYPQIEKSRLMPMNPQACWDWWGYTGSDYLTKDGKQIQAIHNMVMSLEAYLNR